MTTQAAHDLNTCYSGTIDHKLLIAKQLFHRFAKTFAGDQQIIDSLAGLQHAQADLDRHMQIMEMGRRCVVCAAKAGGCCSSYMAGNTDALVLLINLLFDVDIKQRQKGDECCYLGPTGCIFIIKPIFCLNYNCSHIQKAAGRGEMDTLSELTGALLSRQVELEALLLEKIKTIEKQIDSR